MFFKRVISLFKKRLPKQKVRPQIPEFFSPVILHAAHLNIMDASISRLIDVMPIISEVTPKQNHDFDFINGSSYCHVLSLNEAELFDLDAIDECESVIGDSAFYPTAN